MTQTQMEDALKNLDRRVSNVEQILPTLATKQDLERFAKEDFREGIAEAKRHTNVLVESVRDDIRIVAEGVATLASKVDSVLGGLSTLSHRVDSMADGLGTLTNRVDSIATRVDATATGLSTLTSRLEQKGVI